MVDGSIGIMEGAFFVSKNEILHFSNNLLQLNLTRIEQLGTGAVYCQLFDIIFPGKIKMNRVNWKAKNEWEFIVNFKILQQAFERCNIKKHIDIERLAKAKYQDNLEFAQWLKRFYETQEGKIPPDYDPVKERSKYHEGEFDLSFVELRDNPRLKSSVREKGDDSQDKNNKKLISKSKSPIKHISNLAILYSKSNEIRLQNKMKSIQQRNHSNLIEKVIEIDKIMQNLNITEKQKLEQIQTVINTCKEERMLSYELEKPIEDQTQKHHSSLQSNLRLDMEEQIIQEEEPGVVTPIIQNRPKKGIVQQENIEEDLNLKTQGSEEQNQVLKFEQKTLENKNQKQEKIKNNQKLEQLNVAKKINKQPIEKKKL